MAYFVHYNRNEILRLKYFFYIDFFLPNNFTANYQKKKNLQLSRREIRDIYGTRHIGRDQARSLVGLMDFFCFSEVSSLLFCHSIIIIKCMTRGALVLWGVGALP